MSVTSAIGPSRKPSDPSLTLRVLQQQLMYIDLNADLGEGGGHDADLLPLITSANVGCGLHAGDFDTVRLTLELAKKHNVVVGAHPGFADPAHFGRREMTCTDRQIATLAFYQFGGLAALARLAGIDVQYVKPHGALYHQACRDLAYARPLVAVAFLNGLSIVGLRGSQLEAAAAKVNLPFVAEGFIDRRYRPDGSLVPRGEPGAVLTDAAEAVEQAEFLVRTQHVQTLCVHGDTPAAVEFAVKVRAQLLSRGVTLRPFV